MLSTQTYFARHRRELQLAESMLIHRKPPNPSDTRGLVVFAGCDQDCLLIVTDPSVIPGRNGVKNAFAWEHLEQLAVLNRLAGNHCQPRVDILDIDGSVLEAIRNATRIPIHDLYPRENTSYARTVLQQLGGTALSPSQIEAINAAIPADVYYRISLFGWIDFPVISDRFGYIHADILKWKPEGLAGTYDLITFFPGDHWSEMNLALSQLEKLLKPTGVIVFVLPGIEPPIFKEIKQLECYENVEHDIDGYSWTFQHYFYGAEIQP